MLCNNCGFDNQDGCKYCANCGNEIEQAVAQPAKQEGLNDDSALSEEARTAFEKEEFFEFDVNDRVPGMFVQNESVYESLEGRNVIAHGGTEIAFSRGTKKKVLLACLIALIAIVVLGTAGYFLYPKISMAMMDPTTYYVMTEAKASKAVMNEYTAIYDKMASQPFSAKSNVSLIFNEIPGATAQELTALNRFSVQTALECDLAKKHMKNEMSVSYNGTSIIDILMKQTSSKMSVSFPGVTDGELITGTMEWYYDLLQGDEKEIFACTGLKKSEYTKLMSELTKKIMIDSIPTNNAVKSKSDYQGKTYTGVTFTIDNTVATNIMNAFANELESNEQLRTVIVKARQYIAAKMLDMDQSLSSDLSIPSIEEIEESIAMTIEEVRFQASSLSIGSGQYKVLYGSRGEIVMRELSAGSGSVLLGSYSQDKSDVSELIITSDLGEVITIVNTKSQKGKEVSGVITFDVGIEEVETFNIKYQYEKNAKVGGVSTIVGNAELNLKGKLVNDQYLEVIVSAKNIRDQEKTTKMTVKADVTVAGQKASVVLVGTTEYNKGANLDSMSIGDHSTLTDDDQALVMSKIQEKLMKAILGGSTAA